MTSEVRTNEAALDGCVGVSRRCAAIARAIPPAMYGAYWREHHPIGTQLRHCLDHFRCLLRALESGLLDYDARERDAGTETDPVRAAAAFENVAEELERIGAELGTRRLIAAYNGWGNQRCTGCIRECVDTELVAGTASDQHGNGFLRCVKRNTERGVVVPDGQNATVAIISI